MAQIFLGAFAALIFFAPQSVWAACGEILVAKGDIKVEDTKGKAKPAAQGSKVCQGETIVAGPQSRAKVKMEDGNELNISPDSRIKLETYEYKPADNKKKVMLNVLYGKVRAATREENMYNDKAKDGQANTFQVKTKSAVAGVRGTVFVVFFDLPTNKMEVTTIKGLVEVGSLGPNNSIMNPIVVPAGRTTIALPGVPPAPAKEMKPNDIEKLNQETGDQASESGAGQSSPATTTARSPSATTSESSMVTKDDLGTAPTRGPAATTGPTTPPIPAAPPVPPKVPVATIPNVDLVREIQQTGPGKVNIRILIPQ